MGKPHDSKGPKTNGYTRSKINIKLKRKRFEADARQDAYDSLTPQQKLDRLIPGGSSRQRARLAKKNAKIPTSTTPEVKPAKTPKAKSPKKSKTVKA